IEAMKLSYADRDTYYGDQAFVKTPGEGLLSKEYAKQRASMIDPKHASKSFIAGDPLPFDSSVKQWAFWKANEVADEALLDIPMVELLASNGIPKDTTHVSVIDKEGNMFDATPSGGWLDETRAAQLRPRARPRYTLTPSLILKDGKPFMALGTPGGDNQEQTILQA